jgi:hypothetical protein
MTISPAASAPDPVMWVLLSYRVPREPSTPRIAVWQTLKRLGVEAGGTATLWRAQLTQRDQARHLVRALADGVAPPHSVAVASDAAESSS